MEKKKYVFKSAPVTRSEANQYKSLSNQHLTTATGPNPEDLKDTRVNKKDVRWFQIYAAKPDSWQADLTFHRVSTVGGFYVNQAIFCIININTRFAAAWPVDYSVKTKKTEDDNWTPIKRATTLLRGCTTKNADAVLNAFLKCLGYLFYHGKKVKKSVF